MLVKIILKPILDIISFLTNLMKEIREHIKDDTLEEFRDEFIKNYYGENYEYK